MKELLIELEESYKNSLDAFNELESKFNDEDYDDTLTRKYEEGYSDALNMVIQLLKNKGE